MKVYIERNNKIKHIDCTSTEFLEIQHLFTDHVFTKLPRELGETIEERILRYMDLKEKGYILI
jgi:hypothetical protein